MRTRVFGGHWSGVETGLTTYRDTGTRDSDDVLRAITGISHPYADEARVREAQIRQQASGC